MFAKDKKMHFVAGLILALIAGIFLWPIVSALNWRWLVIFIALSRPGFSVFISALVGALKEIIWDWLLKKGTPEWIDFVTTAAGGVLGTAILILLGGEVIG